ncbi:hypothetical protein V1264_011208 [Littorina saxatilis]|uniref:Uncharacterized protein n=1 Tax=Littorina saxatilis TaxID=31220 RepID=A0AAN9GK76_9CAEN
MSISATQPDDGGVFTTGNTSVARNISFKDKVGPVCCDHTCLRRILNIRWTDRIRNEDLWQRADQKPAAQQILRRKWGWIGHTLRKPASSITRQALKWNPQGKRKRGRPRNSWRRDTEAEINRQGKTWSQIERAAQDRVGWRIVVDGLCSPGGS